MSKPSSAGGPAAEKILLVGATGLVGSRIMEACTGRADFQLVALARREAELPAGARMEMVVADPANWSEVLESVRPDVVVNALGTTWNKAGKDEAAFRAVDHDLVLAVAAAAHQFGVERFISISSTMANAASNNFYLKVKGEAEQALMKTGFKRLDIVRPGLLKGPRSDDRRPAERLGMMLAPITDLFLHGKYRAVRSIDARMVADAVLALAKRHAAGRFKHDNDAIRRAANSLPAIAADIADTGG
ncbi:Protein FMP52, mitochondrial [Alteripontixanthobacter maritimus]|uniref:Protein FMP52, mitochondrial n=1 Tax=Alteripontixanthobacter maritimus TaxID=2161824 RepID=A0A369QBZ1_9SPHN|nr:NAD(P)H-binding protein [Alteripontixanthobacter maritimus]RDC60756.1 Protein FMP52, mitochondrial [Alteripontixanthobacter maritimus]